MPKYKFIKDKAEPSDEQIRSKMNFNYIMKQSQDLQHYKNATRPLYKRPLVLGFIVLVGVLTLILILEEVETKTETNNTSSSKDSMLTKDSLAVKRKSN